MAPPLPSRPLRNFGPTSMREVEAIARVHTDLAIDTLAEVCGDKTAPSAARVAAADKLLERGWGKAKQLVQVAGPADGLDDIQLERLIRNRLRALERDAGQNTDGPVALLPAPRAKSEADKTFAG